MRLTRRDWLRLGAAGGLAGWLGAAARTRAGDGPTGGRIYVRARVAPGDRSETSLVAIDADNGTWSQVWGGTEIPATVSPDGRWLATVGNSDAQPDRRGVWIEDLTGAEAPRRLMPERGRPHWSPAGDELIVSVAEEDKVEVRRIRRDGSGAETLPVRDAVIDWSRDGRWLLVNHRDVGQAEGAQAPVSVVRPDGTDARMLTRGSQSPGDPDRFVARWQHRFLPDSTGVVYLTATEAQCSLWRIGLDGGLPRLLVPERERDAPFQAMGSPDGSKLAVMYFDRSVGEDGKKNDVIRDRRLEILDLVTRVSRPIPLPDTVGLWLVDWR